MNSSDLWLAPKDNNFSYRLILTFVASSLGKIIGFFRIQQIAYNFGTSEISDVLLVVFQLIWFVEIVLISAAVAPVLISKIYKLDKDEGGKASLNFFSHNLLICLIISAVYSLILVLFSSTIIEFLFQDTLNSNKPFYISLIFLGAAFPLIKTFSHFLALLNRILENGFYYSTTLIIINLVAIFALNLGLSIGGEMTGALFMVAGILIGGLLSCLVQFLGAPRLSRLKLFDNLYTSNIKNLKNISISNYWYSIIILIGVALVNEIFIYIDYYFASSFRQGSISAIGYTSRIATLINAVFVVSIFIVLEPRWAKSIAKSDPMVWKPSIQKDIVSTISFIFVPFTCVYFFPSEINNILYGSLDYDLKDQERLDDLTQIFSFAILALAMQTISTKAIILTGYQSKMIFLLVSLVPVKILLNFLLSKLYGINGLALSTLFVVCLHAFGNIIILEYNKSGISLNKTDFLKLFINLTLILSFVFFMKSFFSNGYFLLFFCFGSILILNLFIGIIFNMSYAEFFVKEFNQKVKKII